MFGDSQGDYRLIKEKKKLTSKVESLTRKVKILQDKLASGSQDSTPKANPIASSSSNPPAPAPVWDGELVGELGWRVGVRGVRGEGGKDVVVGGGVRGVDIVQSSPLGSVGWELKGESSRFWLVDIALRQFD